MKFVDEDGVERCLGNNPAPLTCAWREFGSVEKETVIPREDWAKLVAAYAPGPADAHLPPVANQNGYGMCNASATSSALEAARLIAGLPPVQLSAGDLYHRISGGVDQGSLLEDGIREATTNGVASVAAVPYLDWRKNHGAIATEDRKRFRALEAVLCPTFDHCLSAVLHGFKLISGIMWFSNFKPGADGWLPRGRGAAGGHAIFGFKPAVRGAADFGIWHRQSWGVWAPQFDNCFVIDEEQYGNQIGGWWGVRAVVNEAGDMPAPKW